MRTFLTQNLKLLFAAHHFVFNSKDPSEIASVVNKKVDTVASWMQSYEWIEAISYWQGNRPTEGDLNLAEKLWTEMLENGEDLFPVDYPDKPAGIKHAVEVLEASALLNSHLFCVDNLGTCKILSKIHAERPLGSPPVQYEGQALENAYYWWVYPNYDDGIYSKVLARANVVGDLVIGTSDETSLVIIRHGRLTLTRQAANDVANVSDARLLVCL